MSLLPSSRESFFRRRRIILNMACNLVLANDAEMIYVIDSDYARGETYGSFSRFLKYEN